MRKQVFIQGALLAFLIFLPFQFALGWSETADVASIRIVIILIGLVWAIGILIAKRFIFPHSVGYWLGWSFLFLSIFSILWAENAEWGIRKIAFLLNFFLLYAVSGWMFMQRIWTPRLLAQGLMWAGGLSSLVGIGQFLYAQFGGAEQVIEVWRQMIVPFFLGPSFGEVVVEYSSWAVNLSGATVFRAIAVFPDPHIAAFFWGLCLPWALAVAWKERSVVGYILSGIICIALLLTFSRGTYFALVIVGMVATGMATMNLGVYARRATIFVGIVGCALLFIPNNPIIDRALSSFSTTDGSNQGRWEMWEYAVESIWEQPWGVGIGNYATYILPSAEYRTPIYAHNTYLDIAAETGVLTLVVWLVWIINTQLRAWMYRKQDAYLLAVVGSLALFSTHAFFDTPLYSVHVLPILLLIIASVESTSTQSHRS